MVEDLTGRRYFDLIDESLSPRQAKDGYYPCPCCDTLEFETAGGFDICSVCDWQDDPVQELYPEENGGANGISLNMARINFANTGTSDPEAARRNAKPKLP